MKSTFLAAWVLFLSACAVVEPPETGAPEGTKCKSSMECRRGLTCISAQCVPSCTNNNDCAAGWTCMEAHVVAVAFSVAVDAGTAKVCAPKRQAEAAIKEHRAQQARQLNTSSWSDTLGTHRVTIRNLHARALLKLEHGNTTGRHIADAIETVVQASDENDAAHDLAQRANAELSR